MGNRGNSRAKIGNEGEEQSREVREMVQCRDEEDDGKTDGEFWGYNVNCLVTSYRK